MTRTLLSLGILLQIGALSATGKEYDPLAIKSGFEADTKDFTVKDEKRSREIPIRVFLPELKSKAPVVLFSPGLGGTREAYPYLGNHWAARGYVVVFLQHPGSDDSVWKDKPLREIKSAMAQAASGENFLLRVKDVPVVLDQLEHWNAAEDHPLKNRLDLKHIGMSGHSFGAITTQSVSGERFVGKAALTDARITAAIAMSPSPPKHGDLDKAFGEVKLPWMLMTGTKDDSPIGDTNAKARMTVFPALPKGDKYELILDGAEHSVFTDREVRGKAAKRNPNHHKAILALSTAFWDSYLNMDKDAKNWLSGDPAQDVLEKEDILHRK